MAGDALIGGLDLAVIVGYFAAIIAFGAYAARHSKGVGDFFLGGQRFAWWLVSFSCVATVVGSYSFVKYSAAGFTFGLASSQTYLNDWFWMPLWMFGWLPLVYYSRITSVPEYFERRFGPRVRLVVTALLLVYLLGYLGINFLTMGKALEALVGWPILAAAAVAALICGIYTSHGGQTAVIFTDLAQGVLLLVAGLVLFGLGLAAVGGLGAFWEALAPLQRQALPAFNDPPEFNFVGIFWQDGMAGGVAFYFINQGILLRFLSARSLGDARKAAGVVLLLLMPLAAIAVSGAGWIGRAMVNQGVLPAELAGGAVFVEVAQRVLPVGLFGLVVAALVAALMSTADTLINAIATITTIDLWKPWRARRGRVDDERSTLRAARIASALATIVGLALVPIFGGYSSIYQAHGAFTAAITPPLAIALLFALCWRRFSRRAALLVLLGGSAAVFASFVWPALVTPFAHGVELGGAKSYSYIRALYGVVVCGALGILGTLVWPAREDAGHLALGPVEALKRVFKGAASRSGPAPRGLATVHGIAATAADDGFARLELSAEDASELAIEEGDIVAVRAAHWLRSGYQALSARAYVTARARHSVGLEQERMRRLHLVEGARVSLRRVL